MGHGQQYCSREGIAYVIENSTPYKLLYILGRSDSEATVMEGCIKITDYSLTARNVWASLALSVGCLLVQF